MQMLMLDYAITVWIEFYQIFISQDHFKDSLHCTNNKIEFTLFRAWSQVTIIIILRAQNYVIIERTLTHNKLRVDTKLTCTLVANKQAGI